jgi:hypothetical protein
MATLPPCPAALEPDVPTTRAEPATVGAPGRSIRLALVLVAVLVAGCEGGAAAAVVATPTGPPAQATAPTPFASPAPRPTSRTEPAGAALAALLAGVGSVATIEDVRRDIGTMGAYPAVMPEATVEAKLHAWEFIVQTAASAPDRSSYGCQVMIRAFLGAYGAALDLGDEAGATQSLRIARELWWWATATYRPAVLDAMRAWLTTDGR